MPTGNLFADTAPPRESERFETLLVHRNLVVERIVSSAAVVQSEYVQPQDEWVMLVQGEAVLNVAGEILTLTSGDYLFLPAGLPHSVQRVSEGALWLAVHLYGPEGLQHPSGTAIDTDPRARAEPAPREVPALAKAGAGAGAGTGA